MSKKTIFNLVLIILLSVSFPLLWLFNQRINYRKFLTLDTKFSLRASSERPEDLSSVNFILNYFNDSGSHGKLHVDVKSSKDFRILGRSIIFSEGIVEVYEYASGEDAEEILNKIEEDPISEDISVANIHMYKNLLIYNKDDIEEVSRILRDLTDE